MDVGLEFKLNWHVYYNIFPSSLDTQNLLFVTCLIPGSFVRSITLLKKRPVNLKLQMNGMWPIIELMLKV